MHEARSFKRPIQDRPSNLRDFAQVIKAYERGPING